MAKDNEELARKKELAREFEKALAAQTAEISKKLTALSARQPAGAHNGYTIIEALFTSAFAAGKYKKPSVFFQKELSWIFGTIVKDRYRDAFLHIVDNIRDFPCGATYCRRSYRAENYLRYANRINLMVINFRHDGYLDADICDILTGNLPEDALCFLQTRSYRPDGFPPELLAYELDRENPRLEGIITDIINGENGFATLSYSLIRGIVMSHNRNMHAQLCKLLVAARLQEGLRQSICENADCGTKEAFMAILATIGEHDLIRYSSVKRAVGTWLGLITEETRDLDRISAKSVALVQRCLEDEAFAAECLNSQDAMQIHIALWSYAFHATEKAELTLQEICARGVHQQVLAAGYYVNTLDNNLLKHTAAKTVLPRFCEEWDIWAVYLPCLIPYHNSTARSIGLGNVDATERLYFSSPQEGAVYYDTLMDIYGKLNKKALTFDPCIFPWFAATLTRSDLLEKAMCIAALTQDLPRICKLCPLIPEFSSDNRALYIRILATVEKAPPVREALLAGLCDKSYYTRQEAVRILQKMELTAEEYRAIEDMLRLRYEDLRNYATELLLKQKDVALGESIVRLLGASKTEKRTAALDMLLQLQKDGVRAHIVTDCTDAIRAIAHPTTQEQILIEQLLPKAAPRAEKVLFTEADRYLPQVEADAFAMECIRDFTACFPDSKMERQASAGIPVTPKAPLLKPKACAAAKQAEELVASLSDFFTAHETEHFSSFYCPDMPISCPSQQFISLDPEKGYSVPRMDLWLQWQEQQRVTPTQLLRMYALLLAREENCSYLKRCGLYISELFGPGFNQAVTYRYKQHMRRIVQALLMAQLDKASRLRLAAAIGIWVARCLPEDMLIGSKSDTPSTEDVLPPGYFYSDEESRRLMELHAKMRCDSSGQFIAHPQIARFLYWLDPGRGPMQKHIIPISVNIYRRSYQAGREYMLKKFGQDIRGMEDTVFDTLFGGSDYLLEKHIFPDTATYFHAHCHGLISDAALYCHLMEKGKLKEALELVTAVCAVYPAEGTQASVRALSGYQGPRLRRKCEELLGADKDRVDTQMLTLCHRVSETLLDTVLSRELVRGDSMSDYSNAVTGIQSLSGADIFVRILAAMGKDPLDRSTYYYGRSGGSKRENLSYLLAHCAPAAGDSAEGLAILLKGTDITVKRLVEAAIYSPDWIDIIGEHLGFTGFKSACYYFMAHTNEQFDEQKKAVIARFTPLSDDELNMGAFDMDWFRSAYNQLGQKNFDLIYDAAKYISDGNKHTRARKFADAALGKLDAAVVEAEIRDKRNKDLLMAYAIIPLADDKDLSHRYFFLQQFLKESRQFGAQRSASEKKAVEAALRNLATNAGFSDTMRLTLRMETQLVTENAALFADHPVQEWVLRLEVDDRGNTDILCFKDGKLLKALPAKIKKDPYVLQLAEMKKQLNEQYRRTRRMFEQAMEDGGVFTPAELRDLSKNPVVRPILSKLVFRSGESLGFFNGEQLSDLHGTVLVGEALAVAHPFHLYKSGHWAEFQKYLFDKQLVQPFRQVFRELYVKTADELGDFRSLRYAGNQIQPKKAAACLKERRWVADVEAGLQKVYYKENIVATIFAMADWFSPADIEAPTLEYVAFYHRKTGEALKIDDIPEVIFSEVMRDVDMAVSVAHAGGVDPETSHSTTEMRAAILGFTLPLLRLENVRIEGSHALVEGKLARYSIHLGSGVVHQIGGTMLNVLPVHSQHRGRIFLPFVDEDPKTAEIISKVILFAEDHKLKDPTILAQIARQ